MSAVGARLEELTAEAPIRERLQWFTREKQWINETHLALCRIPAPTFLERERALWFQAQFREAGWSAVLDRAGNVVATAGEPLPTILPAA